MGYRSQVFVCIPKSEYEKASQEIKEELDNVDEIYSTVLNDGETIGLVFNYNHVKWYNDNWSFPNEEVKLIEDWINALVDKEIPAGILRVGEEMGDIEITGYTDEYELYPEVTVDMSNLTKVLR